LDHPHHNPRFDIDEDILPDGVAILAGAALRYLNNSQFIIVH
jgi:metal-dependent amidase/aminoacylase/carboxypeptidase family protein